MTDEQVKTAVGVIAAATKTLAGATEQLSKTAASLADHAKALVQLAGAAQTATAANDGKEETK